MEAHSVGDVWLDWFSELKDWSIEMKDDPADCQARGLIWTELYGIKNLINSLAAGREPAQFHQERLESL